MKWYKKTNQTKICTQTIQNGVTKKCSIYQKKKKKRDRHQHSLAYLYCSLSLPCGHLEFEYFWDTIQFDDWFNFVAWYVYCMECTVSMYQINNYVILYILYLILCISHDWNYCTIFCIISRSMEASIDGTMLYLKILLTMRKMGTVSTPASQGNNIDLILLRLYFPFIILCNQYSMHKKKAALYCTTYCTIFWNLQNCTDT